MRVDGVSLLQTPDNSVWPSPPQRPALSFVTTENRTQPRTTITLDIIPLKEGFCFGKKGGLGVILHRKNPI